MFELQQFSDKAIDKYQFEQSSITFVFLSQPIFSHPFSVLFLFRKNNNRYWARPQHKYVYPLTSNWLKIWFAHNGKTGRVLRVAKNERYISGDCFQHFRMNSIISIPLIIFHVSFIEQMMLRIVYFTWFICSVPVW